MWPEARSAQAAFTICARNYFAQARVLARSFRHHHPDCDFHIVLVDRRDPDLAACHPDLSLIWVEDIGLPDFSAHAMRFDVIELSTNVKPHCLAQLLRRHERVLYLDPDTCLFDRLDPVFDALTRHSIVLTPASTTPILDGHRPDDLEFLRVGAFNLGFIGVAAGEESRRFLDWWSTRCLEHGFHETSAGVFVDQKWIDLVPCYFEHWHIHKDPGLNMAPWNLHERQLTRAEGKYLVNGQQPLRLFHFSSFDPHAPQTIARRQTRFAVGQRQDLAPLLADYAAELLAAGYDDYAALEYGFDHLPGGDYISPMLRRLYANPAYGFARAEDPFQEGSRLLRLARARRLIGPSVRKAPRWTAQDAARFGWQSRLLDILFRLALRILGPNRYFLLMRYLAHASSIRGQRPL